MIRWPAALLLATLILAAATAAQTTPPLAAVDKKPAPEIGNVKFWVNCKGFTNKDLAGKVVVVHFWSMASEDSKENFGDFAKWSADYKDRGLVVVGVHARNPAEKPEKPAAVKEFIEKQGKGFVSGLDAENTPVAKAWGCRVMPVIFLVDRKGKIRYRWTGALEWQDLQGERIMRKRIEELLAEPGEEKK